MSDQKTNQFQYQSFDNSESRDTHRNYGHELPITPPPYTPFPDHNCDLRKDDVSLIV